MESVLGILSCHRKLLFTDNPRTFVRNTSNHTLDTVAVANDTEGTHSAATWAQLFFTVLSGWLFPTEIWELVQFSRSVVFDS